MEISLLIHPYSETHELLVNRLTESGINVEVLEHGSQMSRRPDWIIRWGNYSRARYKPRFGVINSRDAVRNTSNKVNQIKILSDNAIPTPHIVGTPREDSEFPLFVFRNKHHQGNGVYFVMSFADYKLLAQRGFYADYYSKPVRIKKEYRCHVCNGETVLLVKRLRSDIDLHRDMFLVRNYDNGYTMDRVNPDYWNDTHESLCRIARKAVHVLGLDFGAVDLAVDDFDQIWVFEVNSAPGLTDNSAEFYSENILRIVNGDEDVTQIR